MVQTTCLRGSGPAVSCARKERSYPLRLSGSAIPAARATTAARPVAPKALVASAPAPQPGGPQPPRAARPEPPRAVSSPSGANAATVPQKASYPTVEDFVGNSPLVRLQRLPGTKTSNHILVKLEGNNPAGSVKDRPALSMINEAEAKGRIKPGDTIIEATSGNTGIALAMAAAIKGYNMVLIMPSNMSEERKAAMAAYGATLIDVPPGRIEMARDLADQMQAEGKGVVLDQFGNLDNPLAHIRTTGPEIWRDTNGEVTHFVSSMGTTGTIMGCSEYLKSQNPDITIVGLQPAEGAQIPGIRRWPVEYLPKIFNDSRVDRKMDIYQAEAEEAARAMARCEGIFCGVSSGGAVSAALRLSDQVADATIVAIVCDRGDRYLSTGIYAKEASTLAPCTPSTLRQSARLGMGMRVLVMFNSDYETKEGGDPEDPDDLEPWCPDCQRALPVVERLVAETEIVLLRCDVGPRPEWKDARHPLRGGDIEISSIPTLLYWDHEGEGPGAERLDLGDAETPDDVEAQVREFLLVGMKKY